MAHHILIFVSEIVEDILMAAELGATTVHLHTQNEATGLPTSDFAYWKTIISSIRKFNPEIIVCASLSGQNISDPEVKRTPLRCEGEAKPDMASLTTSSLNFAKSVSVNSPSTIDVLAKRITKVGIKLELEIFDLGMSNAVRYFQKNGLVSQRDLGQSLWSSADSAALFDFGG
ncbi:3-keto-5-aminohexanoate cleavage protein [Bartonella phoceensis]|uniref:3-keto-5-aminohexanoate cleavage protein n=1 Tax=Bartonella phoceensis TaxID=270249 RepID=UPI001ABBAFA0|nr:3-keto-5-aminohexanoate cleavage protein [Bartonella phoceensis]